MSLTLVSRRAVVVPPWQRDVDAADYIRRVEAADGQPLEPLVKAAMARFVIDCKANGIWNAIKASCILAGARTLNGALVPLVGTAPTNNNFVSGDYNRKTGLIGDGSTKYLNSNRAGNADPQNNFHMSCYNSNAHDPATVVPANAGGAMMGNGLAGETGANNIGILGGTDPITYKTFLRHRNGTSDPGIGPTRNLVTFQGASRSDSSGYIARINGTSYTLTRSSQTPLSTNLFVFGRNYGGALDSPCNARLAFYSIGEALDLALLDARVTDLINAIGAAIP